MVKRLVTTGGFILLAAGCGYGTPTSPSSFLPRATAATPTSPAPPANIPAPTTFDPGPTLIPGTPIDAGATVQVTVAANSSNCFHNWDASGRCQQYDFTAPRDGTLRTTLQIPGLSRGLYNPEMFLVTATGGWEYVGSSWPTLEGSLPVKAGLLYRIVIMSYGPFPDTLSLSVDLQ